MLPSKTILTFIAIICAVLFFANVFRRTWMLPSVGLVLLVLSSILLGVIWPGIVQQFQVKPSEPDKEGPFIARNIEATRAAYGIAGTKVTQYDANLTLSADQLKSDTQSLPGVRLLDPALVSDAFEQLQQVRGYYNVAPVLDVDRYKVDGTVRDMVVAVRELDQNGLPDGQRNWANEHTVYTHGYGVVAAYGNQRDRTQPAGREQRRQAGVGRARPAAEGRPDRHVRRRLPAADLLRREQPRLLDRRQGAQRQEPRARPARGAGRRTRRPTPTTARPASRSAGCSTS